METEENKGYGELPKNPIGGMVMGSKEDIIKRFGEKMLPLTYKHKDNTVILIDANGNPVCTDNGDGTWSGLSMDLLGIKAY